MLKQRQFGSIKSVGMGVYRYPCPWGEWGYIRHTVYVYTAYTVYTAVYQLPVYGMRQPYKWVRRQHNVTRGTQTTMEGGRMTENRPIYISHTHLDDDVAGQLH